MVFWTIYNSVDAKSRGKCLYYNAADDVKQRYTCDVGEITSHVLSRIQMFQRKVIIGNNGNSSMNSVRFMMPKTLISTDHS